MNIFHHDKSNVLLVALTLISNSIVAQQALPLDRVHVAHAKEKFSSTLAIKIKDGAGIKARDHMDETTLIEATEKPGAKVASLVTEYVPNATPQSVTKPQHLGNTPIFISVIQKSTKKILTGTVKIFDTENHRLLGGVRSNCYYTIQNPNSKSGDIILFVSVFGFADAMLHMNYNETERDTLKQNVTLFGNFFMVTFELERIKSGAQATLSGVYFYNDAAIMIPGSKIQLNSMLDMLKENPQMRIRIEGHTNGSESGDIITAGPSKNYFALTGDQRTRRGSAKELSEARAEVIKSWLIDQGVASERISTFGWGSDKPVYAAKSPLSLRNARVEMIVD